jgi:hypothetical protein
VTPAQFTESLSRSAPPARLSAALQGLWWAAKGEWDRAHRIVQDEEGAEGAWVHAYLHRVEGDVANAGYWYRQAGRPAGAGPLDDEWQVIAAELLRR